MKTTRAQHDIYFEAVRTRDARFDGKFFVGVKTTGIYCRPICPARPKRENVEFFRTRGDAVAHGYRACLRCRPEVSSDQPAWGGTSAVIRRAARALGELGGRPLCEDEFAKSFGMTARHLRRLFVTEIGRTPKQIADEQRLRLARLLVRDTALSLAEVAHAAGFGSIRRFNAAFRRRFGKTPTAARDRSASKARADRGLTLSLEYRPPFHYENLLVHFAAQRVGRLERVENGVYHRLVEFGGETGWISVSNDPARSRLVVGVDFPDPGRLPDIIGRVRAMFDLDVDPVAVANGLGATPRFRKLVEKHPGLRVPSGWDAFEMAIGTILGQLVSVSRGRDLTAQLIEIVGRESGYSDDLGPIKLFPTPADLATADLTRLGSTGRRKETLKEFGRLVASGEVSLATTQDVDEFTARMLEIPGIGPWTAAYVAMKVLRHADAFPETDLIIARALELHPELPLERLRPWRAYAAILLWREYAEKLSRPKEKR